MQETLTIRAPTMDEYIEREALLCMVRPDDPSDEKAAITIATAKKLIRSLVYRCPVADVAPVRHGHWEWFEEWSPSTPESPKECIDCGWRCGRCKVKLDDMVGWYWDDPHDEPKLNYCPNCGMRADE